MNKNSIKDDELDKVNGRTSQEIAELSYTLKKSNVGIETLKNILKTHGIKANLYDGQYLENIYKNIETNERISHDELIKMIVENEWYM
ncbi:MAG: hypothetical protein IJI66_10160 [Erysipelotrichaceae bacterium]|nr:hypothetical protein [Erysipelotrichaceae bacterium]